MSVPAHVGVGACVSSRVNLPFCVFHAGRPICQSTLQCATGGYEITSSTATGAWIVSGGGFSVYAGRPKYQNAVSNHTHTRERTLLTPCSLTHTRTPLQPVESYLKNASALPPASTFNASGRGYPDVAGLAHYYYVQYGGSPTAVGGTSCSSPVWGGIIGLLNSYRLAAGVLASPALPHSSHRAS